MTHNRDEAVNRPALSPKMYVENGQRLFYPKDLRAGGTWFCVSEQKRLMCIMNGGFSHYESKPPYRLSRGVVLKELEAKDSLQNAVKTYDFSQIEPFYCLHFDWKNRLEIHEVIWDGTKIHLNNRAVNQPILWSSAQSYSPEQRMFKQQQFADFGKTLAENKVEKIWEFHHIKSFGTNEGMQINRGFLQTTSILQFSVTDLDEEIHFHDLLKNEEMQEKIIW